MKDKTNLETFILAFCLIGIMIVSFLYYKLQGTLLNDFAIFISGVSTVGIFILTAFYVIYTNRQLREIQKQRQLNIQPLPNVHIKNGIILD